MAYAYGLAWDFYFLELVRWFSIMESPRPVEHILFEDLAILTSATEVIETHFLWFYFFWFPSFIVGIC